MEGQTEQMIFFPGLGATQDLFREQRKAFPDALFPSWIDPLENESLESYGKRMAASLYEEGRSYILIGMSFGSQVALEVAKHLPTSRIVIISGFRNGTEVSTRFKNQVKWGLGLPDFIIRWIARKILAPYFIKKEALSFEHSQVLIQMSQDIDFSFFRWASKAAALWTYPEPTDSAIKSFQIHGENDPIIRLEELKHPDLILKNARHLIQFTHSKDVNEVIQNAQSSFRH
jgi:pimeloyl-ACP methyl ester carboxylesterase